MTKEDFTPHAVYHELLGYTLQQDYPDDELNEIGGPHVSVEDIADIEIESVTESDSGFIVKGNATLEITTDLDDGDMFSDGYPMTFSYEFNDDGKIVRQLSRNIDTSSFFAGNDYEGYLVERLGHQAAFQTNVMGILSLLAQSPAAPPDKSKRQSNARSTVTAGPEVGIRRAKRNCSEGGIGLQRSTF